jgi:hypothetical protein
VALLGSHFCHNNSYSFEEGATTYPSVKALATGKCDRTPQGFSWAPRPSTMLSYLHNTPCASFFIRAMCLLRAGRLVALTRRQGLGDCDPTASSQKKKGRVVAVWWPAIRAKAAYPRNLFFAALLGYSSLRGIIGPSGLGQTGF